MSASPVDKLLARLAAVGRVYAQGTVSAPSVQEMADCYRLAYRLIEANRQKIELGLSQLADQRRKH